MKKSVPKKSESVDKLANIQRIKEMVQNKEREREEEATKKPPVAIFQMHTDAIKLLADDKNEIFSQIREQDAYDIAVASIFGTNPCHNINERLKAKGIEFQIALPVLDEYVKEVFRHLQKADRKRVEEYLKALESLKGESNIRLTEEKRPMGLLSRFV